MRRNVAAAAGVTVGPPGAADIVGLLEDDVLDPLLGKLDRGADPAEAGADDDDRVVGAHRSAAFPAFAVASSTRSRSAALTASGRSSIAQCPARSSSSSRQPGTAAAMTR